MTFPHRLHFTSATNLTFQTAAETTANQAAMESRYLFLSFSIRVCSAFSFVFWRNTHLSFYHFVAHRFEIFCLHLKRIRVFRTFSGILLFCIILSHFGSYKFLSFSFHINFPHDIGRLSRNRIGTDQQAGNILHCVVPMPQRGGSLGFTHAASYRVWYTYIGR